MSNFFYAPKGGRENSFKFDNNTGLDAENAGDQGSRLHPVPAVLSNAQKTSDTPNPRTGDETISYDGTPFGGDRNNKSHIQTPAQSGEGTMPGEAPDPRC